MNNDLVNNAPVLQLSGIIKNYKQGKQTLEVLSGVDLSIHSGEVIALVGQSGSGKSTLLQIAGLLDKPSGGRIFINGENIGKASDDLRTSLRRDYIGFLIAGKSQQEAADRATILLDKLKLSHRLKHRPAELSGGEQQRVAIARALANSPKLLLADEPTGNLDPNTSEEVFSALLNIIKETGLAALIATHNMELAARMNQQYKLKDGVLENLNEPLFTKVRKNFY